VNAIMLTRGIGLRMKSKITLSLMLIASSNLIAAPQYKIEPLGTLGGDESYASDINENGDIIGTSKTSEGINHAFVSSLIDGRRIITDLKALYKKIQSQAPMQLIIIGR
jgi:probable HAF family extracellular repeat protein